MHYAWKSTIAGLTKENYESANNFMSFYAIDSILWTTNTTNVVLSQDKLGYSWGQSANAMNDSAFKISFKSPNGYFSYNWTADKSINDTLVFVDNSVVGNSYYLTKK